MQICLINGHPDPDSARFCHAVADAYQDGAESAGHGVERVELGALDVPLLTQAADFGAPASEAIQVVQSAITASEHLVLVYPLWLGTLPAKLKALFEQVARAGFLLDTGGDDSSWPAQKMAGKSARVIVTMGMPGLAYRLFFGSHSVKGLEAGILRISGFKPVRHNIFGGVEMGAHRRERLLRVAGAGRARALNTACLAIDFR